MKIGRHLMFLGLLHHPTALMAQGPAAAADFGPQTIEAGSAVVDGRRLELGSFEKPVALGADGRVEILGQLRQSLRAVADGSADALLSVQVYTSPQLTITDSAWSDASTLRPLRHRSHSSDRTMFLDFDGFLVTGSVVPESGDEVAVLRRLGVAPFDSNIGGLVVAALPLSIGYEVGLPLYVHEAGGVVWHRVRVEGRAAGREPQGDLWVVLAESDLGQTRYWIQDHPRRVLASSRRLADGREVRYGIATREGWPRLAAQGPDAIGGLEPGFGLARHMPPPLSAWVAHSIRCRDRSDTPTVTMLSPSQKITGGQGLSPIHSGSSTTPAPIPGASSMVPGPSRPTVIQRCRATSRGLVDIRAPAVTEMRTATTPAAPGQKPLVPTTRADASRYMTSMVDMRSGTTDRMPTGAGPE